MNTSENATLTAEAKINNTELMIIENGSQLVPIRPICDILGVDVESQRRRIKNDEILGSVAVENPATGKDEKRYKMTCLPLKFIFGWLFLINPQKVSPEAKEAVINYKLECYDVLWNHFTGAQKFLEEKEHATEAGMQLLKQAKKGFYGAKKKVKEIEDELYRLSKLTYEDYQRDGMQMSINFDQEEGGQE